MHHLVRSAGVVFIVFYGLQLKVFFLFVHNQEQPENNLAATRTVPTKALESLNP